MKYITSNSYIITRRILIGIFICAIHPLKFYFLPYQIFSLLLRIDRWSESYRTCNDCKSPYHSSGKILIPTKKFIEIMKHIRILRICKIVLSTSWGGVRCLSKASRTDLSITGRILSSNFLLTLSFILLEKSLKLNIVVIKHHWYSS